jgi:hypothetical protein
MELSTTAPTGLAIVTVQNPPDSTPLSTIITGGYGYGTSSTRGGVNSSACVEGMCVLSVTTEGDNDVLVCIAPDPAIQVSQ